MPFIQTSGKGIIFLENMVYGAKSTNIPWFKNNRIKYFKRKFFTTITSAFLPCVKKLTKKIKSATLNIKGLNYLILKIKSFKAF
jgi:hypothetical protein